MTVRVVQLGSPRAKKEGLRIGTVRRPPRGVPKEEFAKRDFYDVWLPALSPSPETIALVKSGDPDKNWPQFEKKFRAEMKESDASRLLDLFAALSHQTDFAIGCYCEDETWCHRSILRDLLAKRNADIA